MRNQHELGLHSLPHLWFSDVVASIGKALLAKPQTACTTMTTNPTGVTQQIAAAIPLMQRSEVEILLASLQVDVDMAWINHFGEHVWMKALIRDGERIGITECCEFDAPCDHHAAPTPAPVDRLEEGIEHGNN